MHAQRIFAFFSERELSFTFAVSVSMVFDDEDKMILVRNLYQLKAYKVTELAN